MSVNHHLDDATVLRYAAGDLHEAFAVVVASHLAMCSVCRAAVRAAEEAGGALVEAVEAEPLAADAFERMMAAMEAAPKADRIEAPVASDMPRPLRRYAGEQLSDVAWKFVAPGVRKASLPLETEGASLFMLSIAPGRKVPEHSHGGAEMTLILSGAYCDRFGRFGPGDIADHDEDVEHQPMVDGEETCICVVATEAPTQFKGLVGRLLQPFVGI